MPLETGQYLSDLNANNPNPTDAASQGDDHLRFIKAVLKTTFPAVAGPVTGSHTELNEAVAAATTGASKLDDGGAHFNTNDTDGFTNPAAGEVDVECGGNAVVKFKDDKSAAFQGAVTSVGPITGPGAIPIGGSLIWWSDTLPDASWGTYAWCNGAEYARSNTKLWAVLGTNFGSGDGTTTANLPDLRDNVPVGKGTMGGATAASRISAGVTGFVSSVLGAIFGEDKHTLVKAEAPKGLIDVTLDDQGHTHDFRLGPSTTTTTLNGVPTTNSGGSIPYGGGSNAGEANVSIASADTGITASVTDNAGDGAHSNVQPSTVCNWIIRTA